MASPVTRVAQGDGGPAILAPGAGAYVAIATLPVPASGSKLYLTQLFLTGLAVTHEVAIRETYASGAYISDPEASGVATLMIEIESIANSGVAAIALAMRDIASVPSSAASWHYDVYEVSGGVEEEVGEGDVLVDHNYGTTDAQRVVDEDGVPVDNALIRAYVTEDYEADDIDTSPPTTQTGSDGRWIEPLMLDPDDYTLTVYNPATKRTDTFELTVATP